MAETFEQTIIIFNRIMEDNEKLIVENDLEISKLEARIENLKLHNISAVNRRKEYQSVLDLLRRESNVSNV